MEVVEEMAEGGQVGGLEGGGPRKRGRGGWLALLICKTANLRTLCLPVLLFVLSTFSTAFSSYGETTRSFSLSLSLAPSISRFDLSSFLTRVSRPLQTHIHTFTHQFILSLSRSSRLHSVSLTYLLSSLRYVP